MGREFKNPSHKWSDVQKINVYVLKWVSIMNINSKAQPIKLMATSIVCELVENVVIQNI